MGRHFSQVMVWLLIRAFGPVRSLPTESNSSFVIEVKGARKISTVIDPSDDKLKLSFVSPFLLLVQESDFVEQVGKGIFGVDEVEP